MRHQVEKRGRADPVAFVYAGWRFNPDTVSDHSGFLAGDDLRQLHSVRARQPGRDGLAIGLRAVVCRRDFSGSGAG